MAKINCKLVVEEISMEIDLCQRNILLDRVQKKSGRLRFDSIIAEIKFDQILCETKSVGKGKNLIKRKEAVL